MIKRGSGEFEAVVTDVDGNEHDVLVKYQGYSDPGFISGPPENCYPPEGEIEIEVTGLPAGVIPDDDEQERLEELAFQHLVDDDHGRDRDYE